MTATMAPQQATELFEGVSIIDCDSHFTEPPDLWTSRVSGSMADRVPVQRTVDGRKLLDEMGIYAQVIYPNGIGFASNHVFAIQDDAQRTAVLQTYNDFLVE